ncbi:MAG: APC family permease [Methylocystaceae bacterium]
MLRQAVRFIFGKSLANEKLAEEKFNVFWGMPILSSDAISSVAYAVEEMLWVLIPAVGLASFVWMPRIAISVIILLLILTFSYRQVVEAYPRGGGAYIVSKDNLGPLYGLIAGASLSVDYTLTVAVSVSAATAAITSAFPVLYFHRVAISLFIVFLLVVGNVRGLRESTRLFSIPTYAFLLSIIILIIASIVKHIGGTAIHPVPLSTSEVTLGTQAITVFLLLKAFSSGCSAVTGVEAISDAVPNFREPSARNAKIAYLLLAASVLITFGGTAYLAKIYEIMPSHYQTVLAQIATITFGKGFMFYFIQATTAIILAMAANTAFAGFPTLLSVIAQDGFVPRQFKMRGHRLNFSNGILFLAVMAAILIIIFKSSTHYLIPLYAIGVFTSFTLAQLGLFMRWIRHKPEGWQWKATINGLGTLVTLTSVLIIGITKFIAGAWIVILIIPAAVKLMLVIRQHYASVAQQLDIPNEYIGQLNMHPKINHYVIVPIDSFNAMVVKALRYAQAMSPNVVAFHVEIHEGEADKLRKKWAMLNTDIELVIKPSPYREVVNSLVKYIDSEEHSSKPGDIITLLLPQFFVSKWWQAILHNNTSLFIANAMLHKHNVVISIMPFYLERVHLWRKANLVKHTEDEE